MTSFSSRKATFAFIFIAALLDIIALGIIIPIFPELIKSFGLSESNTGILNGAFLAIWALMQLFAAPLLGTLSDRFGRRPVILISTAGLAIDYVLMAIAPTLWWLVVGRILAGLTSASFATIFAYVADITTEKDRAKGFGLIGAAFSGGFIIGPSLGGFLGDFGLRAPFWVAACLSFIAFLYGFFVLPESLPKERRMPFSWSRANPLGVLRLLKSHDTLFKLAGVNFIVLFSHYVFHAVFVLYTSYRYGFSNKQTAMLLSLTALLDVFVQAVGVGFFVKKIGEFNTLILGLLFGAFGVISMGLAPSGSLFILALIPMAGWGLSGPATMALMSKYISEKEQGQLQGANMSQFAIAGVFGPLVFGGTYALFVGPLESVNLPGAPFILCGILLCIAAAFTSHIAKHHQK